MKTELIKLMTAAALGSMMVGTASATIAYDNAAIPQNQGYGGSLGLEFDVNQAITITALGAFNSGIIGSLIGVDGTGVTVGIYDRNTKSLVGSSVLFTPVNSGTQINGDAFLNIAPLLLPAGFQGTIVAFNDINYNSGVAGPGPNVTSTMNSGEGAISFVGSSRFLGAFSYPTTVDTGPANRYDAGTFEFQAVPEASTVIAGALLLLPLGASTLRVLNRRSKV